MIQVIKGDISKKVCRTNKNIIFVLFYAFLKQSISIHFRYNIQSAKKLVVPQKVKIILVLYQNGIFSNATNLVITLATLR